MPAPKSRRRAVKLLFGALGLGALGLGFAERRRHVSSSGPRLRIHEGASPPPESRAPTLWMAVATLPPARRAALLDELEAALASIEARANPLLLDFLGESVEDVLRRSQSWLLPLCTAAQALLDPWSAGPDGFAVEVLSRNARPADGDVDAWNRSAEDGRARRARFLAWAASRSLVVRAKSAASLPALEAPLRDACVVPTGAVALVVTRALARAQSPDARLDRVLVRLAAGARSSKSRLAPVDVAPPARDRELLSWIALSERELLVVPRLGALSPPHRFSSEVVALLGGSGAELSSSGA